MWERLRGAFWPPSFSERGSHVGRLALTRELPTYVFRWAVLGIAIFLPGRFAIDVGQRGVGAIFMVFALGAVIVGGALMVYHMRLRFFTKE